MAGLIYSYQTRYCYKLEHVVLTAMVFVKIKYSLYLYRYSQ